MAERVQPRLRVGAVGRQHAEHDAGRAEHHRERARDVDAYAERARGLVAGAGDVGRLVRRREPLARQVERSEHLVAPAPVRDVEEQRPGRVGDVDRVLPRETQAHVVLGQQHVRDTCVRVRLMATEPQQLRGGETRQRTVARQLDQPLASHRALDLRALGARPLVVPEDGRA